MIKEGIKKLADDALEQVAGGANVRHTDADLKKAGINIENKGGKKTYSVIINGKPVTVSESVAMGACDCYILAGNQKLTDSQLKDLIAQS